MYTFHLHLLHNDRFQETAYLIEYLMRFMSKLQPIPKDMQECILKRFIAAVTKQSIMIGGNLVPSGNFI